MRKLTWFALAALVAAAAAAPAVTAEETVKQKVPAERGPAKDKNPQGILRGEYAIMAAECKLTDEQQNTLKTRIAARSEAQEAWMKANGSTLERLQEAVKQPKDPADKEAIRKAAADLKALEADRLKIQATFDAEVRATMTPEQQDAWAAFKLYRPLMARFKKLSPTEDQVKKIKEAAAATAKQLAAVQGDDKAAQGARMEIEAKLRKTVEETILTADQRDLLNTPGPPKPGMKKPDAAK